MTVPLTSSGIQPDTHLQVFGHDFWMCSADLKLRSGFFKKLLDSPEKSILRPEGSIPPFKYQYITEVDERGSWKLVPLGQAIVTKRAFKGNVRDEVEAFWLLLNTLRGRFSTFSSTKQLRKVMNLAEQYLALPALSFALSGSLLKSPILLLSIPTDCEKLFEIAFRIENKVLYKECLIYLCGPWSSPRYLKMPPGQLRSEAEKAHHKLAAFIASSEIQETLVAAHKLFDWWEVAYSDPSYRAPDIVLPFSVPEYYRKIYDHSVIQMASRHDTIRLRIVQMIGSLLKSNLEFDQSGCLPGRPGTFVDHFLCLDVEDEDLPWGIE